MLLRGSPRTKTNWTSEPYWKEVS